MKVQVNAATATASLIMAATPRLPVRTPKNDNFSSISILFTAKQEHTTYSTPTNYLKYIPPVVTKKHHIIIIDYGN